MIIQNLVSNTAFAAHMPSAGWILAILLSATSLEASLESYGIFKGEHYEQASNEAPGSAELIGYGVGAFAVTTPEFDPRFGSAQPDGEFSFPVFLEVIEDRHELVGIQNYYGSPEERDQYFPDGDVTFSLSGSTTNAEATLSFSPTPLPPVPAVVNYAEAQAVDPSQPFVLQWNSFAGAEAQDRIWVQIQSIEGPIFRSPVPGAEGALAGSATEVVIPAGTLTGQEGIQASIVFLKVGQQSAGSLPDSTALTGSYRWTELSLRLEGDIGPGDGPTLIATLPETGTLNVGLDTPVRFDFDRPMAPVTDVTWQAGFALLDDGLFEYSWENDNYTLVATYLPGWPPDSVVIWSLGVGFEDANGNPLQDENLFGQFGTTSGTGPDDCIEGNPLDEEGNFFITRAIRSQQSGPGTLAPHPDGGAFVVASFDPPAEMTPSEVSFDIPSGETLEMRSFFGSPYFYFALFPETVLNEFFPEGNYPARVDPGTGSTIQRTLTFSGNLPPAPELLNHTAAQAIDPVAPFTLTWNTFTGADESSIISLEIMDPDGDIVFTAPNQCLEIELPPTATSIAIPAGTLDPGRVYDLILNFYRLTDSSEHQASGITFSAAQGASTETTLQTIGGTGGDELRLDDFRIGENQRVEGKVSGTTGLVIQIEASSNLIDWEPITVLTLPATGSASFEDSRPLSASGRQFYRALRI